jgi:NCAIR mutase (PurE)-related protein
MNVIYDYDRPKRIGMPEAIYCQDKDVDSLVAIVEELAERSDYPVLLTRLSAQQLSFFPDYLVKQMDYNTLARTAILNGKLPARSGRVAVVTAGTSDLPASEEARITLDFMGVTAERITDVGVAGLWRLQERVNDIRQCDLAIVVAGMDAALPTVVGGLIDIPIIGVPTSVGYGVATGGQTALNAMLSSCAQGIVVTNIDNGFGAACAALRILGADQ